MGPISNGRSCRSAGSGSPRTKFPRRFASSPRWSWIRRGRSPAMSANVVVTGGSRGLGLGVVRRLAAEGYHVIAVARHMSEQLAAAIEAAGQSGTGSVHFAPVVLGV